MLAQIEEQLALRLGRGDLHEPPVAQHVLVDLGADPVHGEGHQAHAHRRVEALDRLHQADVAFLHEIAQRQAIAGITARDVHDEAQVRHDERACGRQVAVSGETIGKRLLVIARQHGNTADAIHVGIETAERVRPGTDRSVELPAHEWTSIDSLLQFTSADISTRKVRVLNDAHSSRNEETAFIIIYLD